MNGRKSKLLIRTAAGGSLLLLFLAYLIFWKGNHFDGSPKFITISKGQSFSSVADSLQAHGIISSSVTFKIAGRILGVTQKIKIGKYSFADGLSNRQIADDIEKGLSIVSTRVTIVEGMRTKVIARVLRKDVGIDSARFISLLGDTSLIGIYPNKSKSLEGYLLPDTYEFFWQEDEEEIVKRCIGEFKEFFVDSLQQRAKQMKMPLNDILTMASIVEGEAVYDDERPVIAGVYYNRLRKRMRLQADPTVQYAAADVPKRLTRNDLKIESPYNTYLHYGLPPGPINNPGRKSILAALYPARHNYLYFVSDYNGRHRFSRTYEEHQRHVREYRRARAVAMGK